MPKVQDIICSIPDLVKDPVVQAGTFCEKHDELERYIGTFSIVFPVNTPRRKWAFRCWHSEIGSMRERLQKVFAFINPLKSKYICESIYCEEGIEVEGKVFPTTRMEWVEGDTINLFVKKNAHHKTELLQLADEFLKMVDFLHVHHIAHGDLQHGNIIVKDSRHLKLVDYDSFFVPGLEGKPVILIGVDDFQHPRRKEQKTTSEKLDYFSELVIYLAILAVAHDPTMVERFPIADKMLFKVEDWGDFEHSEIYAALKAIGVDDITILTDILAGYLKKDSIEDLAPFPEVWKSLTKEPVIMSFTCGNADGVVFRGRKTEVTWTVENVQALRLNSTDIRPDQHKHGMTFTKDTELVLVLQNGLHRVEYRKHIKVVEPPKISFTAGKKKLKRKTDDIESTHLQWNVSNAHSVTLKCGNKVLSTDSSAQNFLVTPEDDAVYELIVVGLDKKTEFHSDIALIVRDTAKVVEFSADKEFTLPGVPVTIRWQVAHANSVKLNGKKVSPQGKEHFTTDRDIDYTLTVKDEFGTRTEKIEIRMLPLPVIKGIMAPTPNIDVSINLETAYPHITPAPAIPEVEADFVSLSAPMAPDLMQEGLFAQLPSVPHQTLAERFSKFIKSIID